MYQQQLERFARAAQFRVADYGNKHFRLDNAAIRELRQCSYFDQWRLATENKWYHVRLEDHSLFLFDPDRGPSYSYLQCPLDVISYRDYLDSMDLEFTRTNRVRYQREYEEVMSTAVLRAHVTPIRYDMDASAYATCLHPAAHIHVGLENEIRLAVRREMRPVAFFLFVMRQMYPSSWRCLLERQQRRRLQ